MRDIIKAILLILSILPIALMLGALLNPFSLGQLYFYGFFQDIVPNFVKTFGFACIPLAIFLSFQFKRPILLAVLLSVLVVLNLLPTPLSNPLVALFTHGPIEFVSAFPLIAFEVIILTFSIFFSIKPTHFLLKPFLVISFISIYLVYTYPLYEISLKNLFLNFNVNLSKQDLKTEGTIYYQAGDKIYSLKLPEKNESLLYSGCNAAIGDIYISPDGKKIICGVGELSTLFFNKETGKTQNLENIKSAFWLSNSQSFLTSSLIGEVDSIDANSLQRTPILRLKSIKPNLMVQNNNFEYYVTSTQLSTDDKNISFTLLAPGQPHKEDLIAYNLDTKKPLILDNITPDDQLIDRQFWVDNSHIAILIQNNKTGGKDLWFVNTKDGSINKYPVANRENYINVVGAINNKIYAIRSIVKPNQDYELIAIKLDGSIEVKNKNFPKVSGVGPHQTIISPDERYFTRNYSNSSLGEEGIIVEDIKGGRTNYVLKENKGSFVEFISWVK